MDEPRDDIDIWLSERVTPLLPHPGTFERIRKRARRRKLGQAAIAAGGAAVIVTAALTVPHFVIPRLNPSGSATPVTSGHGTPPPQHTRPATPKPTLSSPSPTPTATRPPPPAVPGNFAVSSVTFVSAGTGWVIGQAGVPGQCTGPNPNICTSLAATFDGGATWQGVPAPVAGPPDGGSGVSQVRSFDGVSGWAFGPQLYATHDGGQTWTHIATHGLRVTDLETVNGRVFAVWARCTGSGPEFAAYCTSFSLYSTPTGADQWAPVPGMTGLKAQLEPGSAVLSSSVQLVLTGRRGYLLAPDGDLYSGPVTRTAGWQLVTAHGAPVGGCGMPGPAQTNGVPGSEMLAATGTGLIEMCLSKPVGGLQGKYIYYSSDGGRSWTPAGEAPEAATATSLSGSPAGQVLVATTSGVDVSTTAPLVHPHVLLWRAVKGASPHGGFSYLGMTTSTQGVAIPADQSVHAVWLTYDGGKHWQASSVR